MSRTTRLRIVCLAAVAVCMLGLPTWAGPADLRAGPPALLAQPGVRAAQANAVLSIGSAELEAGASATMPMQTSLSGYLLGAVTVDVQYDPAVVDAVACTDDPDGLFDLHGCNPNYGPDTVRFYAVSTHGVTGNLTLAEITFVAVGQPGDVSPLDLTPEEFNDPSGQPIPVTVENGQIRIVSGNALPAPSGLTATAVSDSEIDLTWTDNSSDETAFHVERSPDGSADWAEIATVAAGVTSFEDTGLACNTPYYFRVRAYRAGDGQYSGYSNTAGDTTGACAGNSLIRIDSAWVKEDASTTVSLSAALASYTLGSATVEIQYDPLVVQATACTPDPGGVFDMALCNPLYAGDTVILTALATAGVRGSPVLAEITFQAVGDAGQVSPLLLSATVFTDPNGYPIPTSVQNGAITLWLPTATQYLPLVLRAYR
jgi:hypothetical protein